MGSVPRTRVTVIGDGYWSSVKYGGVLVGRGGGARRQLLRWMFRHGVTAAMKLWLARASRQGFSVGLPRKTAMLNSDWKRRMLQMMVQKLLGVAKEASTACRWSSGVSKARSRLRTHRKASGTSLMRIEASRNERACGSGDVTRKEELAVREEKGEGRAPLFFL
ncbi:hypothetical protein NL676_003639 [Syzygium grande]|nr:hypothetical protein NL676_003639 [Syzygium grande]